MMSDFEAKTVEPFDDYLDIKTFFGATIVGGLLVAAMLLTGLI